MSLKEELQKISKDNCVPDILFREFELTIQHYLGDAAKNGKNEYKLHYRYDSIIKQIEEWCKVNDLTLRTFREGHSQNTGYAISWKD